MSISNGFDKVNDILWLVGLTHTIFGIIPVINISKDVYIDSRVNTQSLTEQCLTLAFLFPSCQDPVHFALPSCK